MCDKDSNGVIDKEELSEMLRSLVEIARTTSLSDDHVTELIDGMFQVSLFIIILIIIVDISNILHLSLVSGCRAREEGLPHVQRLQINDERIQRRLRRDRSRLQGC